ncbi:P-loop containing nucleoside triphosphate hydrolase protein [Meredithblackwellia eburnea MCA 4105]
MAPPKGKQKQPLPSTTDGLVENPFRPEQKPKQRQRPNIVKSGNAGSSKPSTATPDAPSGPPPLFPVGFKTPLSLLQERCQKNGWGKPSVDPKKVSSGTGTGGDVWSASVVLRRTNAKGVDETVYMRPPPSPSPIAVEKSTAMEAKHFAAVYALYRFSNNLRLNLQLPPQTRDYWAALEAEKKSSPPNKTWLWSITPFETAAQAPPPPSSGSTAQTNSSNPSSLSSAFPPQSGGVIGKSVTPSSSRPVTPAPPLPKRWLESPEVRMPTALRDLVEETIRGMMTRFPPSSTPSSYIDDHEDAPPPPTPEDDAILTNLVAVGFRKGHVLSALSYMHSVRNGSTNDPLSQSLAKQPLKDAVTTYLHLHTPEEDLPPAFRSTKPADAMARLATSSGSEELALNWKVGELVLDTGFPREVIAEELRKVGGDEEKAVRGCVARLVGDAEAEEEEERGEEPDAEAEQRRMYELEALEGLFGYRFRTTQKGVEILISAPPSKKNPAADQVVLRVLLSPTSPYPSPNSSYPTFYIYSSTLPPYIRLHLVSLVAEELASRPDWKDLLEAGEGGVVGEMANFLMDSFQQVIDNPPDARGVLAKLSRRAVGSAVDDAAGRSGPSQPGGKGQRTPQSRPPPTAKAQEELLKYLEEIRKKKEYEEMVRVREKLPAWSMREKIVDLIEKNRVVIVSGETGSGKTTQVPSFVMDNAIATLRGASTNIVVTQPRRVSAIGVASRVGAERLEDINDPNSRRLVGYAIRGERKAGRDCRMLFCTTGVILSRLSRGGDPDLEGVSHIFIDEVHERSVDSDFLLLELRDILKRNKNIKVILMSATINQAQFSEYFGGAPCIEIPGFTHPVQDHYLDDIVPHLPNFTPTGKPVRKATQAQLDRMRSSFESRGVTSERHLMALENLTRSERIDYNLVGLTVAYCLKRSGDTPGGVLVFMPGVLEIRQAIDAIRSAVPSSEKIEVFPLHANLSSQEQSSVFRPVKEGHRKIVVATNVAETSITIDGIVFVVDCGRVKENTFDPETGITRLVETWTSRAASRQRRGRAGRTRPGECFKLFTHYTEDNAMATHPRPEIVRIPLEMLCLQIKAMRDTEDVKIFLGKAIDPPDVRAVDSAWATLRQVGAIEEEGGTSAKLTPLGAHLAMIPVDLRLGKMLILAAIFRCLDPILTVVALLSSKPFFLNPMEQREESKKARSMFYTARSDLLSDAKAFAACLAARNQSNAELRNFAEESFISLSTFRDVLSLRTEYLNALSDVGFVPFRSSASAEELNENSSNENLLKAILYAGTGHLIKVKLPPSVFDKGLSGAIERDREAKEVKFFEKEGRVFLHPTSLLFTETRFATPHPVITYFSKHVTTKAFLRDATEVPLYALLLFGPKVNVDHEFGRGLILGPISDPVMFLRAWPRIGILVNSLRTLFDDDLRRNVEEPGWGGGMSSVAATMLACLEKDGGLY